MRLWYWGMIGVMLGSGLIGGCGWLRPSPVPEKPPEVAGQLVPLDEAALAKLDFQDELNFQELERAIEQSLRYYAKLGKNRSFDYGSLTYTPKEMQASLRLFLHIVKNFQGEARLRELKQKFLFWESQNEKGQAFFTGYYEPLLKACAVPCESLQTPLYSRPSDLVQVDLGAFREDLKGRSVIGKVQEGKLIPYDSRAAIADHHSLKERAQALAYVDEVELFFLQIQGSGLLQFPDGRLQRVNYAAQNGHPYRPIGKWMLEKGKLPKGQITLQTLKAYLREHPGEVKEILNYNPSYTFFRPVAEGPLGNIEVPLTPGRSLAADSKLLPRGGLAWIETEYPSGENMPQAPLKRFALIQDTGGAIKGHGRIDIFWGNGSQAEWIAGHMQQPGRLWVFVARKEFLTKATVAQGER